ncbi:MAG: N-6 DNA methylase [Bacteroidales bacterium]|nr:N-6 DNA methylase [Bacteroidales bacterium]
MNPTRQEAFDKISALVERFREHLEEYKRGIYNEHQTRVDYINPFFKALGWDMDNEQGHAEAYREVIHEDKVKVGGATQAPDYAFTLYGQRKFFVDAKKPGINIKGDIAPAYQVRRYGWSAKVPLSVVTDFEEFAIYDCTKKPGPGDKPSVSRIKYLTFEQYTEEFDFLWDIFAKENLPKGRFDKFVQSDTGKKGTATVDEEFLKSIEQWRTYLATSIALRNKALGVDELNYAVQKTIDRIIFLRMCEDRGVEKYGLLRTAAEKGDVYANLWAMFQTADAKYNSGLFDFKEDRITRQLVIDNKVLKTIIGELYYPKCEYEFSVMPADILGSVYERFLGKTIRLTAGHQAKVEEKPEVRKAGGVYYTPKYIVDYIVENTVGKLLEGKTPKEVEKLRICDPACGSGSFLIGAYQYLLDWHLKYYTNRESQKIPASAGMRGPGGEAITPDGNLTTALKKRILLNNIYGVDIDPQAVEVTKLNLLLKALEGETQASINQQMTLFHERVLPNLSHNIQCGNSLIGPDFYDNQYDLFPDQMKKINAFDWHRAFPEVFAEGGFQAVIGNPPYVRQELLGDQKEYFKTHYKVYHGMADLYSYFFERGFGILGKDGLFGIIVANKWMRAKYGEPLRTWLKQKPIRQIIDFGDLPVFQQATTYPCIFIAGGEAESTFRSTEVKTLDFTSLAEYHENNKKQISRESLNPSGWQLVDDAETNLLAKLKEKSIPLGEYVKGKIYRGVLTGLNEAFVIDQATKDRLITEDPRSAEVIKPFLAGRDIKRYQQPVSDKYLIFTRRGIHIDNYPAIRNYLLQFKDKLMPRPPDWKGGEWKGRKPGPYKWYEIQDTVAYWQEFEKPKIIISAINKRGNYTLDLQSVYSNDKTTIIGVEDYFLLGLLNSKACDFFIKASASTKRGGYFEYKPMYLAPLPVPIANQDLNNHHDQIAQLVISLISLNQQIRSANLESQRQQLQRAIDHAERRIDELVYELYGLTEEEVAIIEHEH